ALPRTTAIRYAMAYPKLRCHMVGLSMSPMTRQARNSACRFPWQFVYLKNDNDLSFYMDPKLWTDPKVLALGRKVKSYADPNAKKDQNYNTTMEVKLTNGKICRAFEPYPPGSPHNMVDRDVLRAKFRK